MQIYRAPCSGSTPGFVMAGKHAWWWGRIDFPQLVALLLALFPVFSYGSLSSGHGYVDRVAYLASGNVLEISGWAVSESVGNQTTQLIVSLGDDEIYRGRFAKSERQDVARITGRSDWLRSGFRIQIQLPSGLPDGSHQVRACMRLGDGNEFELTVPTELRELTIERKHQLGAIPWFLIPTVIATGIWLASLKRQGVMLNPVPRLFMAMGAFIFALLIAGGWSGSSFGLAEDATPMIQQTTKLFAGELQSVRGDEWAVESPLAISQAVHQPQYPVLNDMVGPDGQNMLIIGMTQVPVAHVSTLAKPATWGFFLFDLNRALAWQWWFPFFAAFSVIMFTLRRWFSTDWRYAVALALVIVAAPYSVGFSGWPAYVMFFAFTALLSFTTALRARHWGQGMLLGAVLGWALSGYALILYPAWLISMATLALALGVARLLVERSDLRFGGVQWIAMLTAFLVGGAILGSWFLDAKDAIAAINATVYPGGRVAEVGGDIDPWFMLKGWMSPVTMAGRSSMLVASDAGSFVFLAWPLLVAVVVRWVELRRLDAMSVALVLVSLWVLVFMFVGIPPWLAHWSLWGHATSYRMDLVLAVAQCLLIAWLMVPEKQPTQSISTTGYWLAVVVSMIFALSSWFQFKELPVEIISTLSPGFILLVLAMMVTAAFALLVRRYSAVLALLLVWSLSASLPFNPLGQAPNKVEMTPEFLNAWRESGGGRLAVVGHSVWGVTLPAAGVPVVNSLFYYPQTRFWQRLDPKDVQSATYNRYHRLIFTLETLPDSQTYQITSPQLDMVRLRLDPKRFDFRMLGAKGVLSPREYGQPLLANPTLHMVHGTSDWVLFKVDE